MKRNGRMAAFADAPSVEELVRSGAWIAFSVSGGKDSSAAIAATLPLLDAIGHPRERRFMLHSDLGRSEWKSTTPHVERLSDHFGLPLRTVRHKTQDMVARWERRGELGIQRWSRAETVNLVGPWSSASLKFCTAEQKIHVMSAHKKDLEGPVVSVMGIRRDESHGRSRAPFESLDTGMKRHGRTDCMTWNPIADWTTQDVFSVHEEQAIPLHEAYRLGSTRLSCNFCVLASINDLDVSSGQDQNRETYLTLVEMEIRYASSFQPARWLADVRPGILPAATLEGLADAKHKAQERRALEASYPENYRKRRPQELNSSEWDDVARIRDQIARIMGITDHLPDPREAGRLG